MKTIKTTMLFALFFLLSGTICAQTIQSETDVKRTNFKLAFTVGKSGQMEKANIRTSSGKPFIILISGSSNLKSLKMAPGTRVEGSFRYSQIANLDLGSGKIVIEGTGNLKYTSVVGPTGKKVGCPPLCKDSTRLKLKIGEK